MWVADAVGENKAGAKIFFKSFLQKKPEVM